MEYSIKELSSYQELKETADFLFTENENGDNKFYLIQTDLGNIGFTYYHLGIKPSIILKNEVFFIGFGMSIIIYNIVEKKLLYNTTDAMYVVYELINNDLANNIICICEFNILAFNSSGKLSWQCGMQDSIYDYKLDEKNIEIQFEDSSILNISLENGTVI